MILYKYKYKLWFKVVALGMVCLFTWNSISWAMPETPATSTLAPWLRLKPFTDKHGLTFRDTSTLIYGAGELKKLMSSDRLRPGQIATLNERLGNPNVEIEPRIQPAAFKCTGKEYVYAVFHFKEEKKAINALLLEDHAKLTPEELKELRIAKDEVHHLDCPGLEGVWFVNPVTELAKEIHPGQGMGPEETVSSRTAAERMQLLNEQLKENNADVIPKMIQLFENGKPLMVELGFGNGEWILKKACSFPDINFIALEPRLEKAKAELDAQAPQNLVYLHTQDLEVLKYFPKASIDYLVTMNPLSSSDHPAQYPKTFWPLNFLYYTGWHKDIPYWLWNDVLKPGHWVLIRPHGSLDMNEMNGPFLKVQKFDIGTLPAFLDVSGSYWDIRGSRLLANGNTAYRITYNQDAILDPAFRASHNPYSKDVATHVTNFLKEWGYDGVSLGEFLREDQSIMRAEINGSVAGMYRVVRSNNEAEGLRMHFWPGWSEKQKTVLGIAMFEQMAYDLIATKVKKLRQRVSASNDDGITQEMARRIIEDLGTAVSIVGDESASGGKIAELIIDIERVERPPRDIDGRIMKEYLHLFEKRDADVPSESSTVPKTNELDEARTKANEICNESLKREYMPKIPEKTILCHLVADSILPYEQRDDLLNPLQKDMRSRKFDEKVAYFEASESEDFVEQVQRAIERVSADLKDVYGDDFENYAIQFDVACPDTKLVEKILESDLGKTQHVKALAFEPSKEPVQAHGIILALRALYSDNLANLCAAYEFLSGIKPDLEKLEVNDINDFVRKIAFILPKAKIHDPDDIRKLNDIIRENIKQAA